MQSIIKPKALKKGNTIALIAPAGPVSQEQLTRAVNRFENLGFKVVYQNRILDRKGYLAGNDLDRLDEIHNAFLDPGIDAIICIRGGYGSSRIVAKLDYQLIKQNPKIFAGYSDITVLLNAIWQKAGLVTFHGIVGNSEFSEYTTQAFFNILNNEKREAEIYNYPENVIGSIVNGKASGILAGGNLSIIASLMGTAYEIDFKDKIVFIEDIDEAPYRIDRMLTQLLLSGKLQKASGIVLGDFRACDIDEKDKEQKKSFTLSEVLSDRLGNLGIPVLKGFSFGHIKNQTIFPIGINAEIDTSKPYIKLTENPVSQ